ncbi:MAG TPA: hypothetical protein VII71_01045, partial [Verrucomicrobiae bacterium]
LDLLHQRAHLVNRDDARFGFRPCPVHVGIVSVFDFPASQTFVTTIGRVAVNFNWILAVQGFRQSARERFQVFERIANEQIGVAEPPSGKRTFQQLDALRLLWKIIESHIANQSLAENKFLYKPSAANFASTHHGGCNSEFAATENFQLFSRIFFQSQPNGS